MTHQYKSQKSDKFRAWLFGTQEREDLERIVALEKFARLLVHNYDLIGEVRPEDLHNLARASKKLEADYEENASG